jgi:DNA gyrase subunit A
LLYDENELRKIYETGQGTVVLRSKYTYDEINNTIEVYEIPYTTTVQKIVEDITEMIKIKKVTEITDVRDESGFDAKANKEALRIAIDVKRNTDVEKLMLQLFKSTTLQDSFSCNFNVLVSYKPKVLGIKSILNEWIKFRIECISRSVKYDIKQKQDKIHLLEGLQKIVLDIDKVISLIRKTKKKKDVIPNLMKEFDLDEIQASYIVSIQLGNLNEEYLLERTKEIEGLIKEVTQLNKVLVSEKLIKNIIISQLKNVCENYGKPRKTEILYDYADAISKKEVINNYNVMYYLTEHGFFKKVPLTSLRNAGDNKTKDDDKIIKEAQGQNIDDIMFFTNKGNILRLKGHKVEDTKLSNYGMYIPSEFGLEDEVIVNMVVTNFTTPNESVLICFKNGFMTRVKLDMYNSANRVLKGNGESETVLVEHLKEDKELLIFTTDGKALIFNTSEIPTVSSRVAKGVKGINLGEGAEVLKIILDPIENMQLTIKTEKKEMKKKLDYKYHKGSRANAGLFIYNCRQKKDKILNVS